jgi:hypothetical protein
MCPQVLEVTTGTTKTEDGVFSLIKYFLFSCYGLYIILYTHHHSPITTVCWCAVDCISQPLEYFLSRQDLNWQKLSDQPFLCLVVQTFQRL